MSRLKIQHVVSFSSEDSAHPAENLLKDGSGKAWLCKQPGESSAFVILQLEKASRISSVDIGNNGSAFVEVLVGRAGMTADQYQVLVVSSSFMSPIESRNETNTGRVRMFGEEKLNKSVASEKWDYIKIVCSQPFNKHSRYGIAFISLQGNGESDKKQESGTSKIGRFVIREADDDDDTISVGSLFARAKGADKESKTTEPRKGAAAVRDADTSLAAAVLAHAEKVSPPTRKPSERSSFESSKKEERRKHQPEETRRKDSGDWRREAEKKKEKEETDREAKRRDLEKKSKETVPKATPERKPQRTQVFKQLLDKVVFAMSGFQNPLRAELRSKAIEMGAHYKPDWDSRCTHLICAFTNTPKFHQVKGKGKIVKKNWIEECHRQRKRLPWRRYALDPSDAGPESEDEIWEFKPDEKKPKAKETLSKIEPMKTEDPGVSKMKTDESDYDGPTDVDTDQDTDDEILRLQSRQSLKSCAKPEQEESSDTEFETDDVTEPESKKKRLESEKEISGNHHDLSDLPLLADFLDGITVSLDPSLDSQLSRQLYRYITAYKGKIKSDPSESAQYYITEGKIQSTARAKWKITPSWLWACSDEQKLVDPEPYRVS